MGEERMGPIADNRSAAFVAAVNDRSNPTAFRRLHVIR